MTRRPATGEDPVSDAQHAHADVPTTQTNRLVTCPQCGGDSVYGPSNPYRPFCSQRCKNIDFGGWADESFRMPAATEPDAGTPDGHTGLQ